MNKLKIEDLIKSPLIVVFGHNLDAQNFIQNNPNKNIVHWYKKVNQLLLPLHALDVNEKDFKYLSQNKNVDFLLFSSLKDCLHIINQFLISLSEEDFTKSNIFLTLVNDEDIGPLHEEILFRGRGLIKIKNKHDLIAKEVIKLHPFSKYLEHGTFLLDNGIIKLECEINAIFVGESKLNSQVYLKTIMNNQFATTLNNTELIAKVVNYYLIKENTNNSEKSITFNFDFLSFKEEEYLPLPESIHHTEIILEEDLLKLLDSIIIKPLQKTFVFVSLLNNLEDLNYILKIKNHLNKDTLKDIIFFVYLDNIEEIKELLNQHPSLKEVVQFINKNDYLKEEILFERFLEKAIFKVADKYEEARVNKKQNNFILFSRNEWSANGQFKKEANLYPLLNLNFKLNLLGFTLYEELKEKAQITEFFKVYDPLLERIETSKRTNYDLTPPFYTRDVLAFLEHLRWNAFHIVHGYIPMKKELITLKKNKDIELKTHGCLTTFKGLNLYHKILIKQIENQNLTNEEKYLKVDVIKYDYNILDDLEVNLQKLYLSLYKK